MTKELKESPSSMKKIAVSASYSPQYFKEYVPSEIKKQMALDLGMAFLNQDLIDFEGRGITRSGDELVVASIWVAKEWENPELLEEKE